MLQKWKQSAVRGRSWLWGAVWDRVLPSQGSSSTDPLLAARINHRWWGWYRHSSVQLLFQPSLAQRWEHGIIRDLNKGLCSYGKSLIVGRGQELAEGWYPQGARSIRTCGEPVWHCQAVYFCIANNVCKWKITHENFTVTHAQVTAGSCWACGDGLRGVLYWEKGGLKMQRTGNQLLPVHHKTEFKSLLQVFKNLLLGMV